MMLSNAQGSTASLQLIEDCLTLLTFGFAFVMPKIGSVWFSRIERPFIKLARRKDLSVAVIGLAALLLRLALLPLCPIPLPFVPDDFSFLLSADTFVHGRLTNPTPPMWVHFETIHVSMVPTYMSMYFPAQGLLLASGRVLFGHPWFGLLIMSGIMCAAFCWMLQAWLPPSWALLGGIIAVMRLGLFSYWINTYTGAGSIAALGGALVLGALPRLIKTSRFRYAVLLAVGIILVGFTRPYEGLLLCLPVAFVLGRWVFTAANRPAPGALIRLSAFPLAIIVAAAAWSGYYDYRAFGNPFTLPYSVNRAQYAMAPYFVWQSPRPEPVYRHAAMRNFYHVGELDFFSSVHSVSGFLPFTLKKIYLAFQFYAGLVLCVPLIMLRRVFLDRRIRFLIVCVLILSAGMSIQNLSSAPLPCSVRGSFLCHRPAGYAASSTLEARRKARWSGADPRYDGALCSAGRDAYVCWAASCFTRRMARIRLELRLVWAGTLRHRAGACCIRVRTTAWSTAGHCPLYIATPAL